jgi:hypothetical protein
MTCQLLREVYLPSEFARDGSLLTHFVARAAHLGISSYDSLFSTLCSRAAIA